MIASHDIFNGFVKNCQLLKKFAFYDIIWNDLLTDEAIFRRWGVGTVHKIRKNSIEKQNLIFLI